MNILKKNINFKRRYIILLLVINFLILSFCYTYAIFVTKQLQENVAVLVTSGNVIEISSDDINDSKVLVKANESKSIIINLTNTVVTEMNYLLLHEKVPTGVMVYETNGDNSSLGVISGNGSISANITIQNDTNEDVIVKFYCQASHDEIIDKDMGYSYINQIRNYDHSGANEPDLKNLNAIPIYYVASDKTNGVWKKADSLNINGSAWYDYDNGRWANIALVNDEHRDMYLNADVGTVIDDNDILAYFVWIPSFRYNIINSNNPTNYEKDINVIFENGVSKLGSVTCMDNIATLNNKHIYSETCTDEINGKIYENLSTYSHPAFGDLETGFWVGKFQTSSSGKKIVPNAPSFTTTIDKAFENSRQYESTNNSYGISNGNNLDTHLLTNMEWGAITLLSNSLYGKSGNSSYFDEHSYSFKRIYVNANNSSFYTGCSSNYSINSNAFITSNTASCIKYNDLNNYTHTSNGILYSIGEVGPGASTTGTIYGVYDMAGASQEMVAGIVNDESYTLLNDFDEEYFDLYSTNTYIGTINDSNNIGELYRYKLGDGIREHYRNFSDNGLWHNGYLKQSNIGGIIVRGGDANSGKGASIFSSDIISLTENSAYRVAISMNSDL